MTAVPRTPFLPAFAAIALHAGWAHGQTPLESISDASDPAAAPVAAEMTTPTEYDLPPPSTRWNLLFTGLAVTGVSYGLALGASYAWPDERISDELRIPIAGPWMAIADTGCPDDEPDCSTAMLVFTAILTGLDGVLQAGGLGLALESAFIPTANPKPRSSTAPTLRPVPYVAGGDGVGVGVAGTF